MMVFTRVRFGKITKAKGKKIFEKKKSKRLAWLYIIIFYDRKRKTLIVKINHAIKENNYKTIQTQPQYKRYTKYF